MIGLLLPSLGAALLACVLRRSVSGFTGFQFRWWELAAVAFAIELVLYNPPVDSLPAALAFGPWLWVATRLALLTASLRNARPHAVGFIPALAVAFGIGLNTFVVVANGGYMPQSLAAAQAVWGPAQVAAEVPPARLENTRPMDEHSQLVWLADVLPEPNWLPRPNVVSVGDVILALGMSSWIFAQLRGVGTAGEGSQSGAIGNVELDEDVLDVRLDGLDRNYQTLGNRPV